LYIAGHAAAYRCAVFPKPWNTTWGIAIPANQSPEQQEQTLQFLMKALNPESDLEVIQAAGSPVRRESYQLDLLLRFPWLAAQQTMLERCGRLPARPELGRFLGALYPAVYQAFTGELTPQAALENAHRQVLE
jgi:ABC-type glycerol-3-phosphate transport system substrate-binding protein